MESPPDSTMMTVTASVTTLSIETSIHTTIASDCGPGSGSVAEVGSASEHEDESDRETAAGSLFRPGVRN